MKDQALKVIKQMAEKLTIVDVDGNLTFKYVGELSLRGKTYNNPKVTIDSALVDKIADENDEKNAFETIKNELDIIA